MEQLAETADLLLQHINSNPDDQLNEIFLRAFVQQVKLYASSQGERTDTIAEFKGLLEQVLQDTPVIRTRTEQTAKSSISTWLSSDSAILWKTAQANACRAELGMDCEIVVKIRDDSERSAVKKLQPADLVKRAERARAHAAKSTPSLPLAGHAFIAARQLPSGDISLRANHAAGAEVLRQHGKNWVHVFGKSAYVRVPTWGIVIDGMPVQLVDINKEFKQQLVAENHYNWGQGQFDVEIAHVGWLATPRSYLGSLVVEFTNPVVANNAIREGTVWHSHSLTNRSYCKEGRCKMCKKCQKYRHVQAQCPNRKYICGLCAEEHPTWECPHKQSRDYTPKCANCKGPHKAASDSCLIRKDEIARTRQAILMSGSEHRVPQYLQAKIIQQNIDPTPGEAAQIQATKKVVKKTATTGTKHAKKTQPAAAPAPAPALALASGLAPALAPALALAQLQLKSWL
ncbi:hypothetical protein EYB25_003855 [Talaromyces marneffei]|nr:hypothetical protein EYB25_003855 [Talaromyces marneffei]